MERRPGMDRASEKNTLTWMFAIQVSGALVIHADNGSYPVLGGTRARSEDSSLVDLKETELISPVVAQTLDGFLISK